MPPQAPSPSPDNATPARHALARWVGLGALVAGASLAADAAGLPSPSLFAGLIVGLAHALTARTHLRTPGWSAIGAQAVIGATLGAYLRASTLSAVGAHWAPVLGVTVITLGLTVAAGVVLARVSTLDGPTAAFGMIAGGASGIVAIADELGADDRMVALMQYLRVLVIVILTSVVVAVVFAPAGHAVATGTGGPGAGLPADLALTLGAALGGMALAQRLRTPAGWLLGPLLVAGVLTLTGLAGSARVPSAAQDVAFAVIGVQVGLRFTARSVREAGRVLPAALVAIGVLIGACSLLGLALAPLAHVSRLDAYLATTPGGLYAVLATAVGAGANTTFVLSVQVLRLLIMLLAAPTLARRLAGRRGRAWGPAEQA